MLRIAPVRISVITLVATQLFFAQFIFAQDKANPKQPEAAHEAAVAVAHAGDHAKSLRLLNSLIGKFPDFYPAKRDYVVILTWADDCESALTRFAQIKNESLLEDYLVVPVSECYEKQRSIDEAQALLVAANRKHPKNKEIRSALNTLNERIAEDARPELDVSAGKSESDKGAEERKYEIKYTQEITKLTRAYARFLYSKADDKDFETGNMNRLGIGLLHWYRNNTLFDLEFSADVDTKESSENGVRLNITHFPNDNWEISADYASYAEDVPLRAKAIFIEAERMVLNGSYHSDNYQWEWFGGISRYDFSDKNIREAFSTSLGYAYELKEKREQRIIAEYYSSSNTLDGRVYFNPKEDTNITLSWRIDLVFKTSYGRAVDHFTIFTGLYDQKIYDPNTQSPIPQHSHWGIRYESDLELSPISSLYLRAEYASRVYDGESEKEKSVSIGYSRKL